jgi:hypothetical protein
MISFLFDLMFRDLELRSEVWICALVASQVEPQDHFF